MHRLDRRGQRTFTLTAELLWDVAVPQRIVGPEGGTAHIEASGAGFRRLTVDRMAGGEPVTLERLVLAGGDVSGVSTPGEDEGGAVAADVLILIDVEMNGNKARNGGAVVTGDLTAIRTSFIGNIAELGSPSAGTGLGGAVFATDDVVLTNMSFLGNIAASGGALHHDTLGFGPDGSLTATFVTLLDNEASAAGEGAHLQLEGSLSPLTLRGVLVGRTGGSAARPACGGGAFGVGSVTWTDSLAFDATCTGIAPASADEGDGVSGRSRRSRTRASRSCPARPPSACRAATGPDSTGSHAAGRRACRTRTSVAWRARSRRTDAAMRAPSSARSS